MKYIIRQTWRGCFDLPVVGPHPGTVWCAALIAVGTLQGATASVSLAVVGFVAFSAAFGSIYLAGAYDRACVSDRAALRTTEELEGKNNG